MLTESQGMPLLKQIASSQLKISSNKHRVWSEDYNSWGFFSSNITMFDEFLLWCNINRGDRITLDPPGSIKDFYLVVEITRDEEIRESPIWVFKLLSSNAKILNINVKEKTLFLEAAKYL